MAPQEEDDDERHALEIFLDEFFAGSLLRTMMSEDDSAGKGLDHQKGGVIRLTSNSFADRSVYYSARTIR